MVQSRNFVLWTTTRVRATEQDSQNQMEPDPDPDTDLDKGKQTGATRLAQLDKRLVYHHSYGCTSLVV